MLRPATVQDAPLVRRVVQYYIENTAYSFLYRLPTEKDYRDEIRSILKELPYFIATDANGRPLGYVCAHHWRFGAPAYLWDAETTIYLDPAARRLGLGKKLYQALLAALALSGYWNAYAVLADPNPASEAFHAAMGFQLECRQARTGYKNGWQGTSFWCLRLKEGKAAPQGEPKPLKKDELNRIAELCQTGESWQQIVNSMEADRG